MTDPLTAPFAPAERRSDLEIEQEHAKLADHPCSAYFNFFPLPLMVLTPERQIVLANQAFLEAAGAEDLKAYLGRRPGEALGCIYAKADAAGCGTSLFCSQCGALRAILDCARDDAPCRHDCQILRKVDGQTQALDLRVHASPWKQGAVRFCVVTLTDISDQKRRQSLERVFFHDILNTAGSAHGLTQLLESDVPDAVKPTMAALREALASLVDQIRSQRQISALENGEETAEPVRVEALGLIRSVAEEYRKHPTARDKTLRVESDDDDAVVLADRALLRRILSNMVKNALEADPPGSTIRMGLARQDGDVVFWVRNSLVMPEAVRLQVFKRSFSTKGAGRGLGTYSMKLLAENFLKATVGFTSNAADGTRFWARLAPAPAEDDFSPASPWPRTRRF